MKPHQGKATLTQVVHVSQGIDYLLEVADTADSQRYQELKTSIDRSRGAAHWDGLLSGELPTLHVLKVHIRCWEDEVVDQLLMKEKGRDDYCNVRRNETTRENGYLLYISSFREVLAVVP